MIDPLSPDYTNTPVSTQRPQYGYAPADRTATPAVTIVTPFYNTGALFHETAQSVLQQSMQQWEWLIVNDGSTEPEALAILDSYRRRDPRIRVIDHEENKGLSAARNTGFRAAQTQYIVQLDSDDLLEPTAVEKWVWFLESHPEFSFVKGYSVGFGAQEYVWEKGFHNGSAFLEDNLVAATSAIRRAVHSSVGGYDETLRAGLEDWDFWLRCASHGYWGGTVPEYLDWYRRRSNHQERWADVGNADRHRLFLSARRERFPQLWNGGFPQISPRGHMSCETIATATPCKNRLQKDNPRLLILAPWLAMGGADKFTLDLVARLTQQEWGVSLAATLNDEHAWLPQFARYTPDIFILQHFLRLVDYPRFLHYFIHSRQVDIVLIANSELAYGLLPYLRAHCPQVAFVDFCHMEEEQWKNGGYPRLAVEYQDLLDLNIVSSEHLKQWMIKRRADPQRIQVCYTNIDTKEWHPDEELRRKVRKNLNIGQEVPLLLYAARICEQKQPQVFAQVILRLARSESTFMALVAGDGPDFEKLRSFVKTHALRDKVYLLGALPNTRVQELMAAADIFFLPSQWEGIALSCYEAMACGLPVVGADVGGQQELVTLECGLLISRGSEEEEIQAYTAALSALLRDPERRRQMGRAARMRVVKHFPLEQMGERMEWLLREAQRNQVDSPRLLPTLHLGRICASQAIEYVRLSDVADGLWRERGSSERLHLPPHLLDPQSDSWRTLAYFTLRRFFLPYYRAALNKNVKGLLGLKNGLKRLLLRELVR